MSNDDSLRPHQSNKYKQPKLSFRNDKSTEKEVEAGDKINKNIDFVEEKEAEKLPNWMKKLLKFFSYDSKIHKNNKLHYKLKCELCILKPSESSSTKSAKQCTAKNDPCITLTDKCASSFERHLEVRNNNHDCFV